MSSCVHQVKQLATEVDNEHVELVNFIVLILTMLYIQQLSGDIHEEVDTHNRMLDRMVSYLNRESYLMLHAFCNMSNH